MILRLHWPPCCSIGLLAIGLSLSVACRGDSQKSAHQFVLRGDKHAASGDFESADLEYRNAIKALPSSVEAHEKRRALATRRDDAATVATETMTLAALKPRDGALQREAGSILALMGRSNEAETAFRQALAIDRHDTAATRAMAVLSQRAERWSEAEAFWAAVSASPDGDPFALADYYASRRRFADAEAELRTSMDLPARREGARLRLAQVFHATGRTAAADRLIEAAIADNRESASPWLLRAQLRMADRHSDEAARALSAALTVDPRSLDALSALTAIDLATKRDAAAIKRIDESVRRAPDRVPLLMLAAPAYASAGQLSKAENTYNRLIELAPAELTAYTGLAQVYIVQKRLEAARQQFVKVVERQPSNVPAWTMVGLLLEAQDHRAEAQAHYEAIMAKHPGAGVAANNLACIYLEQGRVDDALRMALVAKKQLRLPQANDTLGWIYYIKNDSTNAIPPLAASVQADPDNPLYRYHLGLAYLQAGRVAAARDELVRAQASPRPFKGKEDVGRVLRTTDAKN